tara:strand:+ start:46335 stop:48296 length:1962 start_codon:yes stop_codon:yes gene_type:complete
MLYFKSLFKIEWEDQHEDASQETCQFHNLKTKSFRVKGSMDMKRLIISTLLVSIPFFAWSQSALDSLQQLDVVVLKTDMGLNRFSNTQKTEQLSDTILLRSAASLTDVLNYNSTIYFKENGLGMVSSASFRGTTAQQTAVVWNGININSQFNGQTDFNTINVRNFNTVTIRSGGGSVLYGSGAIGGSIHLNNTLKFNLGFNSNLFLRYGSFNTWDGSLKSGFSNKKFAINFEVSRTNSDNDFQFVDSDKKNLNGQYYNQSFSANVAYKFNAKNTLKFYSYLYDGERHFALLNPNEKPTKYQDFNTRNLMEWVGLYSQFTSRLKVAYITENYNYFENIESSFATGAEAKTFIVKHDLAFKVSKNILLNSVIDITQTEAEGLSIETATRTITSFNLLLKHNITSRLLYEVSFRKELTDNYKTPFLFNAGINYKPFHSYTLTLNGSRNFRMPTFNDLYWEGSGNEYLKPEDSYQIEMGHAFQHKGVSLSATGFYNDINDMIRWIPAGSNWNPINTDHVKTYGLEAELEIKQDFQNHQFTLGGNYGYTVSENQETKKQLIYVPKHKATGWFNYEFKHVSAFYQLLYVGEVFILSDNNPKYTIDAYTVSNIGAEYALGANNQYALGFQIKNLFNDNYQSVANRFMPGINYNFYFNLNF